jgi:hypothetical protein
VTFEELSGQRGTRVFMVDDGSIDVFLSRSPSPFRTGSPNVSDPDTFYAYWRPTLMARHRDEAGADTLFAAVIEPLDGPSSITNVQKLSGASDLERIALSIEFADGRRDVVLAALTDPSTGKPATGTVTGTDGSDAFSLTGRVGVWSSVSDSPVQLIGGTEFSYPGGTLTLDEASYDGTITGATRAVDGCGVDSLVTDATLSEGDALAGRFVRATFGAYAVNSADDSYPLGIEQQSGFTGLYRSERVIVQDGKTYIVLDDDPALLFEAGVVYETKRPYRAFTGEVSFEIELSAAD